MIKTAYILAAVGILTASLPAMADKRPAAVYFSDGTVVQGDLSLTPGRRFKLNVPEGGSIYTTDMVTGEKVKYGKVRQFDLAPLREIRFYPLREEMRQKWKFTEKTSYNVETAEADYTPAAKKFWGEAYPLRYLGATVLFNSGEQLEGNLYTTVLYLRADTGNRKLILRSKQRGKEGDGMTDLVFVERIRLLDEGRDFAAKVPVRIKQPFLSSDDALQALTRTSLTPIPTGRVDNENWHIESAFGEPVYLAARQGERYLVGWPLESARPDNPLFELADDFLHRQRDFYNEKKLLGVIETPSRNELLTLVSLRRRFAPTHFGTIGGEWDHERNTVVEPWRLSIWRWQYDRENRDLILSARGTFFRVIFLPDRPTPDVRLSEPLWQLSQTINRRAKQGSDTGEPAN